MRKVLKLIFVLIVVLSLLMSSIISLFLLSNKNSKAIQNLGCFIANERYIPGLCNFEKIQYLGCTWKVPSYFTKISTPSYFSADEDTIYIHESNLGYYSISFQKITPPIFRKKPKSKNKLFKEKQKIGDFTREIQFSIENKEKFFTELKSVVITRNGYNEKVIFYNIYDAPYLTECLNKVNKGRYLF
ncbi:hypothetical protein THERMOT_977 [Bathymodiolus thermophilus thioautotrophic gill symbiont]|uniref:Uncharacterized protein n=2 Tax=Bathymodiolus thermophilus thioautotrophic gill symbiont TaxID=2360 RepID=A0A3G3IL73_9GAMM|nr:hypothetical protein MS2017_0821 [Bathymodiolus thermophilus thioautotrophic gill symbiont]CAB5499102.1 hypothetical protein THERMOT_977 [Bathymodiolus thermophilus thioautotrophic gill symbiont]